MGEKLKPCLECDGPECPWWDFVAWDCCQITKAHLTEPPKLKAEVLAALAKAKSQPIVNLTDRNEQHHEQ